MKSLNFNNDHISNKNEHEQGKLMKKLLIGTCLLTLSFSSFTGEISLDHCQVTVSDRGIALFTNEISSDITTEDGNIYQGTEGNCLELIKDAKKNLELQSISVKEINLRYIIPTK